MYHISVAGCSRFPKELSVDTVFHIQVHLIQMCEERKNLHKRVWKRACEYQPDSLTGDVIDSLMY